MATVAELEAQIADLKRRNAELEHAVQVAQRRADESDTRATQAEQATHRATLERHIAAGAAGAGIHPAALEDVVDKALRAGDWQLNSKGQMVRIVEGLPDVDTSGNYVTPASWLKSLRSEAPYLFADTEQQGASQDRPNPWTKEHWNLSDQTAVARESMAKAEQMAKAAGSFLGATKPAR